MIIQNLVATLIENTRKPSVIQNLVSTFEEHQSIKNITEFSPNISDTDLTKATIFGVMIRKTPESYLSYRI